MEPPHLPRDLPEAIAANREELRRRSRAERVSSFWLWIGILTGPVAFAVVRIASIVLLSRNCARVAGTDLLGLSPPQAATAAITVLGALVTMGAGLVSWRIWRQTSLPEDEVTTENIPRVPFWALGGMLVSGFCLLALALTGGLALTLSASCPQAPQREGARIAPGLFEYRTVVGLEPSRGFAAVRVRSLLASTSQTESAHVLPRPRGVAGF